MRYITLQDYKRDDARGKFDIPRGTPLDGHDGCLWYDGKDVCNDHSAVMRMYFARDDDGRGLERGALARAIEDALSLNACGDVQSRNERWDAVWADELCQRYRKKSIADYWLWAIEFYNAPIEDLEHIAALVGVGKGA